MQNSTRARLHDWGAALGLHGSNRARRLTACKTLTAWRRPRQLCASGSVGGLVRGTCKRRYGGRWKRIRRQLRQRQQRRVAASTIG